MPATPSTPDSFPETPLSSRGEPVAESAARRTSHDRLGAIEAYGALVDGRDVEIGGADQQRAELGLAQRAEELGEPTARDVDVERLLVMAPDLEFDLAAGNLAEDL